MRQYEVGDRVVYKYTGSGLGNSFHNGRQGTVMPNSETFYRMTFVKFDNIPVGWFYTKNLRPFVTELKYDPTQAGDTDDDI